MGCASGKVAVETDPIAGDWRWPFVTAERRMEGGILQRVITELLRQATRTPLDFIVPIVADYVWSTIGSDSFIDVRGLFIKPMLEDEKPFKMIHDPKRRRWDLVQIVRIRWPWARLQFVDRDFGTRRFEPNLGVWFRLDDDANADCVAPPLSRSHSARSARLPVQSVEGDLLDHFYPLQKLTADQVVDLPCPMHQSQSALAEPRIPNAWQPDNVRFGCLRCVCAHVCLKRGKCDRAGVGCNHDVVAGTAGTFWGRWYVVEVIENHQDCFYVIGDVPKPLPVRSRVSKNSQRLAPYRSRVRLHISSLTQLTTPLSSTSTSTSTHSVGTRTI